MPGFLDLLERAATGPIMSEMATIAGSHPAFGLRPSDGWLVDVIAEMKVNYETLNRLAFILITGGNIGSTALPVLCGYCGGPAGTAVVSTAYMLMGLLVHQGNYQLTFPVHFRHGCSTTRDVLWVVSTSYQAASRNIPMPTIWLVYVARGPNTEIYFYESAAYLLCAVTSGAPSVQTPHPAKAVKVDGITPLEAEFGVEMAVAATRFTRSQANELVLSMNLRDRFSVMVGGGPVTQEWASQIGANGYGDSAIQAVKVAKQLMSQRGSIG